MNENCFAAKSVYCLEFRYFAETGEVEGCPGPPLAMGLYKDKAAIAPSLLQLDKGKTGTYRHHQWRRARWIHTVRLFVGCWHLDTAEIRRRSMGGYLHFAFLHLTFFFKRRKLLQNFNKNARFGVRAIWWAINLGVLRSTSVALSSSSKICLLRIKILSIYHNRLFCSGHFGPFWVVFVRLCHSLSFELTVYVT